MRHAAATLLALALGAACAVLVACSGGGDRGLVPAARANAMLDELDRVGRAVRHGDCDAVSSNVADLQDQVNRLSNTVDPELRRRLQEGVNHLADIAPDECMNQQAEAQTQTTETTPETTPTETTPETTPTETQTAPPATETTPPPAETTTPPVETIPPSGSGGATVPSDPGRSGGAEPTP